MAAVAIPLAMKAAATVLTAKTVEAVTKKRSSPAAAAPPPPPTVMPDIEGIKRARRKSEAARVGGGRASTIFTQPASSGSLGPA